MVYSITLGYMVMYYSIKVTGIFANTKPKTFTQYYKVRFSSVRLRLGPNL